jgi:hypothetical protein
MIVCRKCSRRHPDGTEFCACGAFLEFDGEQVADEVPTTPAEPASLRPRMPAGDSVDADLPGVTPAAAERAVSESRAWAGLPGSEPASDRPASSSVTARLPDEPAKPRPAEHVTVQPSGRPGDVTCADCGTANATERQFCQHCGRALTTTDAATTGAAVRTRDLRKSSWWRRIGRRLTGRVQTTDPRQVAAQAGRLSRGGLSSRSLMFRAGGVMVVLAGLLAFLGPWGGTVMGWTRERLGASRYTVMDIDEALTVARADPDTAPEDFPLQGAEKLVDLKRNTAWATRWLDRADPGLEEAPADADCPTPARTDSFLRIEFEEPTDVARIRVFGGRDDSTRDAFLRPRLLEIRVDDDDACHYVGLEDEGTLSKHDFEHDDITTLELRVVGVYADPESEPTVEITELVLERLR